MVVLGELGMGKTSLLDDVRAAAEARGFALLETRGEEADAELGFAALLTLLRPFARELDALAGEFGDDVHAALTLGPRHGTHERRVRLGVYQIVTNLADRAPVGILVDDAQHLDAATSAVLAFVLGRLARDPVAAVLTVEGELPSPLANLALPSVALRPLPNERLQHLVRADIANAGDAIADEPLARCCAMAGGNPLVAIELARSLSADERAGRVELASLPKPPGALARRFSMRFDALDGHVGRALVVAAADDTGRIDVVRAALARLDEPSDALEAAERAGLLELDGPTVRFTHPMLRAVAYHRVAAPSRRAVHRALAAVLSRPEDAAARAWQLAAAADGEDETAAEALELVAVDLSRRGGGASAARVFERAAMLSPGGPAQTARCLAAAEEWLGAFEPDAASRALAAIGASDDPDVLVGAAQVARWADGPVAALERVRAATDPAVRGVASALEADLLLDAVGEAAAAEVAGRVLDTAGGDGARDLASLVLARAGLSSAPTIGADPPSTRLDALLTVRRTQATVEAGGAVVSAPLRHVEASVARATAARHAGDVVDAYERLVLEVQLGAVPVSLARVVLEVALADVEQLLGRDADARVRIRRALALFRERRARGIGAAAWWVDGRLALDAGDTSTACASLESAARSRPNLYAADLALALVGIRRPTEAEHWLDAAAHRHERGALSSVRADRARAALRGDDGLFAHAADAAAAASLPIEAAETDLAYAEHLARDGRRDESRDAAERVRHALARRGAGGWAGRLGRLLDAPSPAADVAADLTAAEYRVALAVANGATNREAAAELYLSVKTVDFHLQNIYRKLGLRSRTELAIRLSRDLVPASPSGKASS